MNRHSVSSGPRTATRAMRLRAVALFIATCAVSTAFTTRDAGAQQATRRVVQDGEVSGLELALEGTRAPVRGGRMRYLLTVYEVVGQRALRPAPGASIRVAASFQRDRPLAELVTDALGRAEVTLDVPPDRADTPSDHHLVFDVRSPRRVRRRFELDVRAVPSLALEWVAERTTVAPGAPLRLLGRLLSRTSGLPVADAEVRVAVLGPHGEPGAPRALRTDATGAFAATFTAPRTPQTLRVRATHGGASPGSATTSELAVEVRRTEAPALVVRAASVRAIVEGPGAIDVDVFVRTPEGRPVADARLTLGAPPRLAPGEAAPPATRTDREGHARLSWRLRAADIPAGEVVDVEAPITALRVGASASEGRVRVRVARRPHVVRTSVEGGALVPGVPGRVFVRVVRADGAPAAGVAVTLAGARLGGTQRAQTDAAGFAAIATTPAPEARDAVPDACGGATALAATLTVAGARTTTDAICLPVDPDGTLRVHPLRPQLRAGEALDVAITRARAVARAPVVVTLLAATMDGDGDTLTPITARILPAGTERVVLPTPAEHAGALVVRARPLVDDAGGGGLTEVRGGSATVLATRGAPLTTALTDDADGAHRLRASGVHPRSVAAFALDAPGAATLAARLHALDGPFAAALAETPASTLRLEAVLAARTALDLAAPAVLRDGAVLPLPAPHDPARLGVLRDPLRARARFVEGRLALVLRTLEERIAEREPDALDEVAVQTPRGWAFNRELLDALTGDPAFGPEGARGLDGLPLTMDALTALDPALTWDRMARRITRKRLFSLLIALRALVRERDLDLAWAWRGEPGGLLPRLLTLTDDETGEPRLTRAGLFDAWGRPFVLRPAPGGRARFALLAPLTGFEVLSAGPDGRPGNADDVWDPLARMLPAGGAWAAAVDEDGFLAQARGVALGRATLDALARTVDAEAALDGDVLTNAPSAGAQRGAVPAPLPVDDPRALAPESLPAGSAMPPRALHGDALRLALRIPDATRPLAVVAQTLADDGARAVVLRTLPMRPALRIDAALPTRLRAGETLTVPLHVTATSDAVRAARVTLEADAPLDAHLAGRPDEAANAPLALTGAGRAETRALVLTVPADATTGTVTLRVQASSDDAPTRTLTHTFTLDDGRPLRRATHGALLDEARTLTAEIPADARVLEAALVLTAPDALTRDPDARTLARGDPALLAWADAVAGRTPDAAVVALLRAAHGPTDDTADNDPEATLRAACALVATSATAPADPDAARHLERLTRAVAQALDTTSPLSPAVARRIARANRDTSGLPDAQTHRDAERTLALHAAVAGALAVGVPSSSADALPSLGSPTPLARGLQTLRDSLRARFATHRSAPGAVARIAAALLLDRTDDPEARAMAALAAQALVDADGLRYLPRTDGVGTPPREDLGGTFALAAAARQIGDTALLARLRPTLAQRVDRALATGGETAFWALAAGAYGALGPSAALDPAIITLSEDGHTETAPTTDTSRRILLAPAAPGQTQRVTLTPSVGAAPRLARLVVTYTRAPAARGDAPLALSLQGDARAARWSQRPRTRRREHRPGDARRGGARRRPPRRRHGRRGHGGRTHRHPGRRRGARPRSPRRPPHPPRAPTRRRAAHAAAHAALARARRVQRPRRRRVGRRAPRATHRPAAAHAPHRRGRRRALSRDAPRRRCYDSPPP